MSIGCSDGEAIDVNKLGSDTAAAAAFDLSADAFEKMLNELEVKSSEGVMLLLFFTCNRIAFVGTLRAIEAICLSAAFIAYSANLGQS